MNTTHLNPDVLRLCLALFAFPPPGILVAMKYILFFVISLYHTLSDLSWDYLQRVIRSRLMIFLDFSGFFFLRGTAKFWNITSYQESARTIDYF